MKTLYYTLIVTLFSYGSLLAQQWQSNGNDIYNTNTGNIGIGTTTLDPNYRLTVVGGINIGGEGNNGSIKVRHINGKHYENSSIDNLYLNYNTGRSVYVGYGGQNSNMYVSGKFGIGTTTLDPDCRLTVVGGINIGGEGNGSIKVRHINGKHYENSSIDNLYLNYNTGRSVYVGYGGQNSNMYVSGKFGIGTTSVGNHELAVEGSIGAREIRVELGTWSDFVFKKDYSLPTLDEVETHIKAKGHLKDIPSEAEVKANGINLGEMDAKLLQKIEELMLYTIAQQKLIEAIRQEVNLIKQENKSLRNTIEHLKNK